MQHQARKKKERKLKTRREGKTIFVIKEILIDKIIRLHTGFSHVHSIHSRASSFVLLKSSGVSTKGSFKSL